ncbi:MAG: DUF5131 family protein [Dehalococcoidia bacterium]|nr:DUF5131 family protein [Dehalococcoidia bacterium]
MGKTTPIAWTDNTLNLWWGCKKVSPGCTNCYAERLSKQFGKEFDVPWRTSAANWAQAYKWNREAWQSGKPVHVFVNSMSDFFDNRVPVEWREEAWALMLACTHLTFQVLTKRPGYMPAWAKTHPWPEHIWAGTSVESAKYLPRLTVQARVPAKTRFVSFEPLLGPMGDLKPWFYKCVCGARPLPRNFGQLASAAPRRPVDCTCKGLTVQQAIIGGESGPGHRPMEIAWLEDIATQCKAAGVLVFVKQAAAIRPGQQEDIPDALWKLKEMP